MSSSSRANANAPSPDNGKAPLVTPAKIPPPPSEVSSRASTYVSKASYHEPLDIEVDFNDDDDDSIQKSSSSSDNDDDNQLVTLHRRDGLVEGDIDEMIARFDHHPTFTTTGSGDGGTFLDVDELWDEHIQFLVYCTDMSGYYTSSRRFSAQELSFQIEKIKTAQNEVEDHLKEVWQSLKDYHYTQQTIAAAVFKFIHNGENFIRSFSSTLKGNENNKSRDLDVKMVESIYDYKKKIGQQHRVYMQKVDEKRHDTLKKLDLVEQQFQRERKLLFETLQTKFANLIKGAMNVDEIVDILQERFEAEKISISQAAPCGNLELVKRLGMELEQQKHNLGAQRKKLMALLTSTPLNNSIESREGETQLRASIEKQSALISQLENKLFEENVKLAKKPKAQHLAIIKDLEILLASARKLQNLESAIARNHPTQKQEIERDFLLEKEKADSQFKDTLDKFIAFCQQQKTNLLSATITITITTTNTTNLEKWNQLSIGLSVLVNDIVMYAGDLKVSMMCERGLALLKQYEKGVLLLRNHQEYLFILNFFTRFTQKLETIKNY